MIIDVKITLKKGVLDPQGAAVHAALSGLGFEDVNDVRIGKIIELNVATSTREQACQEVKEMCEKLLANTVIENYEIMPV